MPGAVAVVRTLCAQHEAIQAARRADGVELFAASGKEFVDVGLVADVEDKMVFWRVKNVVHGKRQFDHPEVRSKVSASLGEDRNQLLTDFFRQGFQLRDSELFDIEWGMDAIE